MPHSWPEAQLGLGLETSEPCSGAPFMLLMASPTVWLCFVMLLLWCGDRGPSADVTCSLCCRPGGIYQLPSLLSDLGLWAPPHSLVRQLYLIRVLLHLSGFPLAVSGCVGGQGSLPFAHALGSCLVAMPGRRSSPLLFSKKIDPPLPC